MKHRSLDDTFEFVTGFSILEKVTFVKLFDES